VLHDVLPTKRNLKKVKYDDIQSCMKFVLSVHQTFYSSLKSDGTAHSEETEDSDCELGESIL
jgi:hypothetical protein